MEGVRVIRVWSYISANQGFLKRTLDYLSFMVSAVIASIFIKRVDLVVATSPQFFTAVAGFVVGFAKRRPWVFELRDLWPESIRAVGAMKDGLALRILVRLESFLYRRATAIVCVTQSFRRHLIERGIAPRKISVVTNGVELGQFSPRPKPSDLVAQHRLEDRFVAGYIGTHGMAHGLETLIEAAGLLIDDPTVTILMLGDGAEKPRLKALAENAANIVFLDSVPKDAVADHWALLDVSIIHLKKNDTFKTVIPSKIFESVAMGLPVILGVEGESAEIVRQEGIGIAIEPGSPKALADAIRLMANDKLLHATCSANGLVMARKYDRRELAAGMLLGLREVVASPSTPVVTAVASEG